MTQLSLYPDHQFYEFWRMKEFILAGKAKITLRSEKTLIHHTYKIKKGAENVWFVSRLGANGHYLYLGTIFPEGFTATRKTCSYAKFHPGFAAFAWFWRWVGEREQMPPNVTVYHEGKCGMCGLPLTDPVSVKEGYGPECRKKRLRRGFINDKVTA